MLRLVNVARTRVVLVLPTTSSYCLRNHFSTDDKKDGGSSSSSSELVIPLQAANNATTWSPRQNDKVSAYSGPRFEQTDLAAQVHWLWERVDGGRV